MSVKRFVLAVLSSLAIATSAGAEGIWVPSVEWRKTLADDFLDFELVYLDTSDLMIKFAIRLKEGREYDPEKFEQLSWRFTTEQACDMEVLYAKPLPWMIHARVEDDKGMVIRDRYIDCAEIIKKLYDFPGGRSFVRSQLKKAKMNEGH